MKKLLISAALLSAMSGTVTAQDSAVFNFTATLSPEGYTGTTALNPFTPGTVTNALVNGEGGFSALASQDWLKFDGQIVISDFTGDGTYTVGGTGTDAGGIYYHSPLLNRIDAVSLRTEGALGSESLALGAGRRDGNPTQNRDDIYLPDFSPNGTATVTVSGNYVSIDYALDFSTLPTTNAEFLRNGDTPTDISDILEANNSVFSFIGANGSGNAIADVQDKGADATTPFGAFSSREDIVDGNLSNTIVNTTIKVLNAEIDRDNISSDGRSATNPETVFFIGDGEYAPFFADEGQLYFFDLTEADIAASVAVAPVPLPAAFWLFGSALLGLFGVSRRRKAQS